MQSTRSQFSCGISRDSVTLIALHTGARGLIITQEARGTHKSNLNSISVFFTERCTIRTETTTHGQEYIQTLQVALGEYIHHMTYMTLALRWLST